ncbi:MAG: hypothetical protein ACREJS_14680, partial [Candidatus Rokuibacteriota bacterium]
MTHRPFRRLAACALLVSCSSLATGPLVGCDDSRAADEQVSEVIAKSIALRQASGVTDDAAISTLSAAAGNTDLSAGTKVNAQTAVAQAEFERANALIADLRADRAQVHRLVWEINQLAAQIAAGSSAVAGFSQLEPTESLKAVQDKIAEARGKGEDSAWFTHGDSRIPTLSAVTQDISRLGGDVSKREDQIEGLKSQRQKLLDDADAAFAQSEGLKGKEAVAEFTRASDLRKQASDLGVQIEQKEAAVEPLRRELGIAQGQKKILDNVIASLQDQAKLLQGGWDQIKEQTDAQRRLSQSLLEGGGSSAAAGTQPAGEGNSVAAKGKRLAEISAAAQTKFDAVVIHLNNSVSAFQQAADAADQVQRDIKDEQANLADKSTGRAKALDNFKAVYDPAIYRLEQARAQHALAALYADRAATLAAKKQMIENLSATLERAQMRMPADVEDAEVSSNLEDARNRTDEHYQKVTELLVTVAEAPLASQDRKDAAQVARSMALYD